MNTLNREKNRQCQTKNICILIADIKNIYNKLISKGYEEIAVWQKDLDALEKLNDMMLDALNNIEQRNTSASKAEKNTAEAVKYSLNNRFSQDIQEWFDTTTSEERKTSGKRFLVGTTTDVLKSIDVKDYSIYFGGSKINKILADNDSMSLDVIKQAVKLLEDPILIMESKTVENSIVIFGEVYTKSNKPVMISVLLSPENKNGEILDYGVITSAYGRRVSNLQNLIDTSKIYYVNEDKNRTDKWLKALGLQLPSALTKYGPINKITYSDKKVKQIFSTKRDADQKQKQLDIINETNPAPNTYSTWIRTVNDIKTLSETLEDEDWEYEVINPDLTRTDIQNAIESGEITVYSSYPIENGVFVSPSRMEAESYSGDGRVYEKTVDINDVAWIDPTQGQYAKVDDVKFATKRDADYMAAVEIGDMETAQRTVDEAARAAGYTIKAYHGTLSKGFTVFDKSYIGSRFSYDDVGFFFIDRRSIAEDYAGSEFDASQKGTVFETYLKIKKPLRVNKQFCLANGLGNPFRDNDVIDVWDSYSDYIKEEAEGINADGIILDDGMSKMFVVYDSNQIKSADHVTYDDNGEVIPLSKRFDRGEDDIRFATKRLTNTQATPYTIDDNSPLSYNNRAKPNPRSSINWVYKAGLFSVVENKLFHQKISEINQGSKAFKKNADGEYMLPIENKIVFTDGNYDYPEITKIIEFMSESQTEISEARRVIYSVEKGESSFKASLRALENLFGQGFVYEYHSGDNRPYEWEGRIPKGRNRKAIIRNYIQMQNGAGNASNGGANQSVTPSTKRQSSVSEDASDYIRDTKEFKEIIDIVDQRYRLTNHKKLSPQAIDRFAGRLLLKSHSKYSRELLTERLTALFDYIASRTIIIEKRCLLC